MFDENTGVTQHDLTPTHASWLNQNPQAPTLPSSDATLSDEFYQILEDSDDMIILLDDHKRILWHNSASVAILGAFVAKPIIHEPIDQVLLNEDFLEKFAIAFNELLISRSKQQFRYDGKVYRGEIYEANLRPLHSAVVLIIKNITYVHHLEQMRTDFVGNVSHEMRTPLTVLMGYIETFMNAPNLEPKWQRGLTLMNEQAKRMNNLVNDLLMLSRLEHDDGEQMVAVDMPKVLMQVFDDARASNQEFGHVLDIHLDTERHVLGIEQYLYSAILNLVMNAMKYTPSDGAEMGRQGEIEMIWEETSEGGVLSITDNGIGIDEVHLARLTERFYRVDSGRSRATGGTGLGLAIVKHILYKHGALLRVESVVGQGSTFRILFPKDRLI